MSIEASNDRVRKMSLINCKCFSRNSWFIALHALLQFVVWSFLDAKTTATLVRTWWDELHVTSYPHPPLPHLDSVTVKFVTSLAWWRLRLAWPGRVARGLGIGGPPAHQLSPQSDLTLPRQPRSQGLFLWSERERDGNTRDPGNKVDSRKFLFLQISLFPLFFFLALIFCGGDVRHIFLQSQLKFFPALFLWFSHHSLHFISSLLTAFYNYQPLNFTCHTFTVQQNGCQNLRSNKYDLILL